MSYKQCQDAFKDKGQNALKGFKENNGKAALREVPENDWQVPLDWDPEHE